MITITGVVKEFRWVNPHTWLYVSVDDGKGGKVEWAAEGRAPGVLLRAGWSRSSLKSGETVTVYMSPAKDGKPTAPFSPISQRRNKDRKEMEFGRPQQGAVSRATGTPGRSNPRRF